MASKGRRLDDNQGLPDSADLPHRPGRTLWWRRVLYALFLVVVTAPLTLPAAIYLGLRWHVNWLIAAQPAPTLSKLDRALLVHFHLPQYRDLRNLYQAVCTEYDPLLMYRPREGECEFANVEFDAPVTFKSGARQDLLESGERNILLLGDSYAMGWGVRDNETFGAALERDTGYNVDNLSVSSYGTARQLLKAAERGDLEKYDLLLIAYCWNDLEENQSYLRGRYTLPRPRPEEREYREPEIYPLREFPHFVNRFYSPKYRSRWRRFARAARRGVRVEQIGGEVHRQPVERLLEEFSKENDLPPTLVFYLNDHGVRHFDGWETTTAKARYIDVQPVTQDFFVLDGHLRVSGHEVVAGRLKPWIEEMMATGAGTESDSAALVP